MTDQHISEEELFEATSESIIASASEESELKKRQLHLRSLSDPELKQRDTSRRRSSLKQPLPLMAGKKNNKLAKEQGQSSTMDLLDTSTEIGSRGEDGRLQRIRGEPSMVFNVTKESGQVIRVDFWKDVAKLEVDSVEKLLKSSHLDKEYDMTQFIEGIIYQGFDRVFYIKFALSKMSLMMFSQFALVGAIRGSNFTKIVETCEDFPEGLKSAYSSLSFVKKPKKKRDLTILRCTASIPQWCAYWMKVANVDKKIGDEECPACLQFPGAASLPMSKRIRLQHLKFSIRFSQLLPGGSFNLNIYLTAFRNSVQVEYMPPSLLEVLEVTSDSSAKMISEDEITESTKQLVTKS
uniref:Nucleocapsid protein n=1 Tax=Coniothyrium diplodiella negative-stranded RNA-like virus 1 TaxID=2802532 RepID=A0A7T8I1D6_9VIRU|nr:nucleocapsid protein [Coniothyrium diplodiella negative-stranded RNA-like virus 1]